jgi:hypothetical protein
VVNKTLVRRGAVASFDFLRWKRLEEVRDRKERRRREGRREKRGRKEASRGGQRVVEKPKPT